MRDNLGQFSVRLGAIGRWIWRGFGRPGCRIDNCGSYGAPQIWVNTQAFSLGSFCFDARIDPKFPPDVGEFHRIREASVPHHLSQGGHPRAREEQPRKVGRPINAHEPAANEGIGRWRQFRLALLRAAALESLTESPRRQMGMC